MRRPVLVVAAAALHSAEMQIALFVLLNLAAQCQQLGAHASSSGGGHGVQLRLDLSQPAAPFTHNWKRSFGSGHALMGTRADWQQHLKLAVHELGVQGLRMHGVLDDDMSVVPVDGYGKRKEYSWYNVDRVYDYMLSLGVRPVVTPLPGQAAYAVHHSCRDPVHRAVWISQSLSIAWL